ncbi:Similar to hypothetical protein [Tuber melanosporum Mel28]; acc. no. XP_002842263 [Pyronema omphalodes CBS 100304]|uniref:DUF1996 domain-containing protein n=1 Tax=Pyronema omphalodes (strain CBS 100304) TaxID=1076935 RepID=U4L4M7_PYROM|nr:Similar to hypothetical protein [Tuber melanosporum Mel28]; acc. no. XP_002842263 [Pyronema omphalodes CBS 100304]
MLSKSLFVISLLALEASAFWRLPCRQRLALERIDPIDTPGKVAHHVHTIHGGNGFSQAGTNDDLRASTCSSCSVKEDKSAYWTPNMYWEAPDGSLTALNQTGGMLVYYLQRGDNIQPFPPNLRIIAGDNRLRDFPWTDLEKSLWAPAGLSTNQPFLRQQAIGFNCLNYNQPAEAALGLNSIPQDRLCVDGLRAEVFFPSCWDGKNVDSDDHRSHMAYPDTMDNGKCPPTHPVRVPSLFFETIWNVNAVAGKGGRLVFSNGDATGYGYHGDFMNGWEQDVLERAINTCTDPSGIVEKCQEFTFYTEAEYSQCTKKPEIKEDVWGPMMQLPGCNVITSGPAYAAMGGCADDKKNDLSSAKPNLPAFNDLGKGLVGKLPEFADSAASNVASAAGSAIAKAKAAAPAAPAVPAVNSPAAAPAAAAAPIVAEAAAPAGDVSAPGPAKPVANDPYLVVVTVTSYVHAPTSTKTVQAQDAVVTVTGQTQTVTVTAGHADASKLANAHKRRHHL